ncbi:MAG: lysophospholipid acyltransferase family protein [Pseudomonadota bacterium]
MTAGAADAGRPPAPRAARVTLAHRLEAALVTAASGLFRLLGVDRASSLGGWVGRTLGPRLKALSRRAERNLKAAYPDKTDADIAEIIAGVWENLGRTAAEFSHLKAFRPFEEGGRIEVSGAEHIEAVKASGKPAVFVSGHFANWEIMSIVLHRCGIDYCVVYRAANNPLVDAQVIRWRTGVMSLNQAPKGKDGAKRILAAMKAGQSLAMLVDQKMNDGIAAPFFGREAMTAPAAARMALRFGAPVIPLSVERLRGARFHFRAHPPLTVTPTGDTGADVLTLTSDINRFLERQITAHPSQWLWLHNRWPG